MAPSLQLAEREAIVTVVVHSELQFSLGSICFISYSLHCDFLGVNFTWLPAFFLVSVYCFALTIT